MCEGGEATVHCNELNFAGLVGNDIYRSVVFFPSYHITSGGVLRILRFCKKRW